MSQAGPPPGVAAPPEGATPSLSAAEALAATPFFAELSDVDLARLVPELEEYQFQPGEAVFGEGAPGDGLYLIRSGTVEITVDEDGGAQKVTTLEAPASFGETALLTDAPRSATAVAATPLAVWKLPRERFEELLEGHPRLALQLAAMLADRLAETTRRLADSQEEVATVARVTYTMLNPSAQALLRRVAAFGELDVELARAALGSDWSDDLFRQLVDEAVFLRVTDRPGSYAFIQDSVRDFLLRQLLAEVGKRRVNAWRCRAADALEARPDAEPADVLRLLYDAEDWPRLARLLEGRGAAVAERDPVRIEGYLRALPPRLLWRRPGLVRLLAECCAAQGKLEQAIETYREGEKRDPAARAGPLAVAYQRALGELYKQVGREEDSLACVRRAMELGGKADPSDDGVGDGPHSLTESPSEDGRDEGWGRAPEDTDESRLAALMAGFQWRNLSRRSLVTLGVLALTALAWVLPPPPGLSPSGLRVLATIGALVALGFLDVLPEYLLGLLMIAAWVVTGTLPPEVAMAGFGNPTWFLLLASMAIGTAVARSGLLYRGAIEIVRHLPPRHWIRCVTLGALGLLFSPGMPSPPGRVMLALPLAQDIADALRYPPRSAGSAGLALATYIGFGPMGTLFLTGSPLCLIVYGLFPPEVQERMNWVNWFLAGLPTFAVLFALTMAFILWRFRPEGPDVLPEETLALQRRVLGRLSRDEWSALGVLLAMLVGFSTQSLHRIDPAWLAIAALGVLFLIGALDDDGFKQGVNLSFLLYIGVVFGFAEILAHVGVDRWLGQNLEGLAGLTGGSPTLFLMVVAAIAVLLGLALRPGPISALVALALYPTAATIGVNPWVVAMTVMLGTNLWLYPQQNVLYLTAYYASGERSFTHAQARPLAFAYAAFVFASILVSIPYWRWLGLIT